MIIAWLQIRECNRNRTKNLHDDRGKLYYRGVFQGKKLIRERAADIMQGDVQCTVLLLHHKAEVNMQRPK